MKATFEYELRCEPEDMRIRGNASACGDDAQDLETEQWIEDQLRRGNEWAWCCAHVVCTVTVDGETLEYEGHDYLGGCSYLSEKDFMHLEGYYPQMCDEAREDLLAKIQRAADAGDVAKRVLRALKMGGE